MYRRRPLAGAFTHPSCMVYPPACDEEPEPEPEPEPQPTAEQLEWRRPSYEVQGPFENPSKYAIKPIRLEVHALYS